jgi:hypothetical protein
MPINEQKSRLWVSVHEASLLCLTDLFRSND